MGPLPPLMSMARIVAIVLVVVVVSGLMECLRVLVEMLLLLVGDVLTESVRLPPGY